MKHLFLPIILSFTLTACGGDSGGGTASTSTAPAPTPFSADKTITLADIANPDVVNTAPESSIFQTTGSLAITDTEVTVQGLAVKLNDSSAYRREDATDDWSFDDEDAFGLDRVITLSRIAPTETGSPVTGSPSVALKLTDGAMTAKIYADAEYTGLAVETGTGFFGFDSQYMAYVTWGGEQDETNLDHTSKTSTLTDIDGMMIAGIESNVSGFPASNAVTFGGEGKGMYGIIVDGGTNIFATTFTTTAIVDFVAHDIDFSTTCTACTLPSGVDVDFTNQTLNFSNGNGISEAVTLNDGALSGTLDARFYGGAAWEFGGIFALANATSYYYGAFGAKRDAMTYDRVFDTMYLNDAVAVTHEQTISTEYADIDALVGNNASITMNALGVFGDIRTDYVRASHIASLNDGDITPSNSITRLSGAAAAITFDATKITAVNLYLDNTTYSAAGNANGDEVTNSTITEAPDGSTATLNLYRGSNTEAVTIFGYTSTNIAYIDWAVSKVGTDLTEANTNLTDANYDIKGMMVAGVETTTLIDTGKTVFTGKGRGYVNFADATRKGVKFTLNANIDFMAKSVGLVSTASKLCTDDTFGTCTAGDSSYDFKTTEAISYDGNNISGAIIANSAEAGYKGFADARFYGAAR